MRVMAVMRAEKKPMEKPVAVEDVVMMMKAKMDRSAGTRHHRSTGLRAYVAHIDRCCQCRSIFCAMPCNIWKGCGMECHAILDYGGEGWRTTSKRFEMRM